MTENEHLLVCLAEECVEVAQRADKALRFGLDEIQPGQELTTAQRIVVEFTDLMAVAQMCVERGIFTMQDPLYEQKIQAKIEKVKHFMRYAREKGIIT